MADTKNTIRVKGQVKWFNPKLGHGFMKFEDGRASVRIHISCIKASNVEVPLEGAIVDCDVVVDPKGSACVKVYSVDNTNGIRRTGAPAMTSPLSDWVRATVKWYNDKKGFGFLIDHRKDEPDIFMHVDVLDDQNFPYPERGEVVEVKYADTTRGRTAFAIREI